MKPLLRWAGSKTKLLPLISQFWSPDRRRYVEAFAGSASLFFHLEPQLAAINDINSDLINAYLQLRSRPQELFATVSKIDRDSKTYYAVRGSLRSISEPFERAAAFIYLNRHCFNGIYRTNRNGEFNVPYANRKTGAVPDIERWLSCASALSSVELSCEDFESFLMRTVKRGDFVYLDPPYAVSNRRIFSQYSAQTFGEGDLVRLARVLKVLDQRGATFVVSYAQSPETRLLSEGWFVRRKMAQRNVAGFTEHRRRAVEVIISNVQPRLAGATHG